MEQIAVEYPQAIICMAGDYNGLPDIDIVAVTGLLQLVRDPTRGTSHLDRVYATQVCFMNVKVVESTVKSDHRAILLNNSVTNVRDRNKSVTRVQYRRRSPNQHAACLSYLQSNPTLLLNPDDGTQAVADRIYASILYLLDTFYPVRNITITSKDPPFYTPTIKSLVRHKNKLMRAGKVEAAGALAKRVGKEIIKYNTAELYRVTTKTPSKEVWQKIKQLGGHGNRSIVATPLVNAALLNEHYAAVSSDPESVTPPLSMSTARQPVHHFSEFSVFRVLDSLRPSAAGLDGVPPWLLRLAAPFLALPLSMLYNLSLQESIVPSQWKIAYIVPIPKNPTPVNPSDFRPLSITSVISRVFERLFVRKFLYPSFSDPPPPLRFGDQFAFRPTGSTTAAVIANLECITTMLRTEPFVRVVSLDFSKAFDTVRHSTLLSKLANLRLPDEAYNWIVEYLCEHTHCTKFAGEISGFAKVGAGVFQGTGSGPALFDVAASDLSARDIVNKINKYADDTYLIIPGSNVDSTTQELEHIEQWARANNLTVNRAKSAEIIITGSRRRIKVPGSWATPPPIPGIVRNQNINMLGVTFTHTLSVSDHVANVVQSCSRSLYTLRILKAHGMSQTVLHRIFEATTLAKLTYASCSWIGYASMEDISRLNTFIRKSVRLNYCKPIVLEDIFQNLDDRLFKNIILDNSHVLYPFLPPKKVKRYSLRERRHNFSLKVSDSPYDKSNFINRMLLYKAY